MTAAALNPIFTSTQFLPVIFNAPEVIVHSDLIPEQLVAGAMAANSEHRWFIDLTAGEVITVQAAATGEADLAVAILDPTGSTIYSGNNAPAGEVERAEGISVGVDGRYQLRLTDAANTDTYYAMMLTRENYFDYRFMGLISSGDKITTTINVEQDHFWNFYATNGQGVFVEVTPQGDEDLILELYGPDAKSVSVFVDNGGGGENEWLTKVIRQTGIYTIRVGEYNFEPGSYTISIIIMRPI